jgi:hypothetical protein
VTDASFIIRHSAFGLVWDKNYYTTFDSPDEVIRLGGRENEGQKDLDSFDLLLLIFAWWRQIIANPLTVNLSLLLL